ncbi:caspase-3-like isoform X2 [Dendronephthya gigantea]|uniref:caspase-3-like isoform X2 n=1 Tax=Dendronephthya gigantea TaxID=151771 RepID=UPI00106D2A73|nr:caspase-3-like isoform X2 [Dendronephthya gigantea]
MASLKLNSHMIKNAFVLFIVNEKFRYHSRRTGALADKDNIEEFGCEMNFTINDISDIKLKDTSALKFDHKGHLLTHDLTAREMKNLFLTISTGDFSSYDAFICFISSYGEAGGISGVDGETIPIQFIVDQFIANDEYRTLVGKPKLFFTQNCRGIDKGTFSVFHGDNENDIDAIADSGYNIPISMPLAADALVAYSSATGYESFRSKEMGSCFINKLTQVLRRHAHQMNLTDMLTIVNDEVDRMASVEGKEKQMPCFTSNLNALSIRFSPLTKISPPRSQ